MTATATPAVLPRPRAVALRHAALTLWAPALVPVLLGMLGNGSSHAASSFWQMFPLVPGAIFGALTGFQGVWFVLAAAGPTLFAFGGLYLAAREMPPRLLCGVETLVVALVALEAIGLVCALKA